MSDILDLDALIPQPKKVKIQGKLVDVYPPRVMHLIKMQRVWEVFKSGKIAEGDALEMIREALEPIIPAIKTDKEIDFTLEQLTALLDYAQSISLPEKVGGKTPEPPKTEKKMPGASQ